MVLQVIDQCIILNQIVNNNCSEHCKTEKDFLKNKPTNIFTTNQLSEQMEFNEVAKKVQDLIAEGQTEEAIHALMEYTKITDSPQHEDALLLSGQFRQWKRENMLGVEQSSSELRRIEMSILTILKGSVMDEKSPTGTATAPISAPSVKHSSGDSSIKKMAPIIGGVLGLIAVIIVVWSLMSDSSSKPAAQNEPAVALNQSDKTGTTQPPAGSNPAESTSSAPNQQQAAPAATSVTTEPPANADYSKLPIPAGTNLAVGKKFFTPDKKYFLSFGEDGNLCVRRAGNESFTWGSYQAGAPLGGKASIMQDDGNLVIHNADGKWIWGTQTTDPSGFLAVTPQGGLVVVNGGGQVIWKGTQVR